MQKFAEQLESRRLLSAVYPTIYEQYMVELYNWARANPDAAAAKYGTALNEGLSAGTISSAAKQPLAINPYLTDGARTFAQWMIDHDQFGHYVDGSNPGARMTAAGYTFSGGWGWGENLALRYSSASLNTTTTVAREFSDLYIDSGIAGRGHRTNMFDASWKEIGSGVGLGLYNGYNAVLTAQDFAHSGSTSFLTGVAYTDSSQDGLYTPGEQMAGVQITAVRAGDGASFTTTTWDSGGYSLALPSGTYTIWGMGGSLGGWVHYQNVTIGSLNVKLDFRPDDVNSSTGPGDPPEDGFATISGGILSVPGTTGADTIELSVAGNTLSVTRNAQTLKFNVTNATSVYIAAGDGNDTITIGDDVPWTSIRGGNGDDLIHAGGTTDVLRGDGGNDTIYGGWGKDRLSGGDGDDVLHGEPGADRIWGGSGNDSIYGGSHNDRLWGEDGNDSLWGQNQNDILDGGNGTDYISGGRNIDTVDYSSRSGDLLVEITDDVNVPTGNSGETGEDDNVFHDIENILGGAGNDRLIGSESANLIRGGGGNDTIYGMAGADTLFGDAGSDRFFALDSIADQIDGGADRDTVSADASDLLTSIESA